MVVRRIRWRSPGRPCGVALCLLVSACGSTESAPADTSPAIEPELATSKASSTAPTVAVEPAKVDAAAAARHQKTARRHSQEGQWSEAIAEFERATAADPSDGRLLCELGWTQFRGSQGEEAAATLGRGIARLEAAMAVDDALRKPLGACLYSLGRVVEAGETANAKATAAGHYRRSLELRPGNSVVERRLAALSGEAKDGPTPTPTPAVTPASMTCADGPGARIDLMAWSESVRAHAGLPESFTPKLAQLGLGEIDDEPFVDPFADEQSPAQVRADVTLSTLRLGEREASVVHVSVHDDGSGRADLVAVLLPGPSGELCLAGEIRHGTTMCGSNCLSDGPPLTLGKVPLLAADVDALQVDTSSGACCGIERGGITETSFYGVEGATLVKLGEFQTMLTWYNSPHLPVKETSATVELAGDYPRQIAVKTDIRCTFDCTVAERRAMLSRRDAASSGAEKAAITSEIDEACGPEAAACEESTSRARYVYRDGAYQPTS